MILTTKKCKCGMSIMCELGDGTNDGDLISHDNCKCSLSELNEGSNK
ncbi:hypothetical protein LCGC14_1293230 [marine sediment metagenome]|uniref:Uncharacterized protein n=1 Tax=marine sediment metagenome TaxID=412755 RepID=A0A0F9N8B0_9ZZZZ